MDQLIDALISKVGLSQQQAKEVMDVVQAFLKDKLPTDVMDQIGGALGGVAGAAGAAADSATDAAGAATDAAGAAADKAADAGSGVVDSIKGVFGR